MDFFGFILLVICLVLEFAHFYLLSDLESCKPYFFKYPLNPTFIFFFWYSDNTNAIFHYCSTGPWGCGGDFILCSLCCSDWIISIDLFSKLLIMSSVISTLLSSLPAIFFLFCYCIFRFYHFYLILFYNFHFFTEIFYFYLFWDNL